jgi:hypothetical protein
MLVQTDPAWADIVIGTASEDITIGEEGCLLVWLCIANQLLGNSLFPDELATQLLRVGGFKSDGDLLWSKLSQTESIVWMYTDKNDFPIFGLVLLEYARPCGSHFVLEYLGTEYDPKPGTARSEIKSFRNFTFIQ